MATNTALYDAGCDITGHAAAAITNARFLMVAATRRAGGPAGISDAAGGDGNIVVQHCTATAHAIGVSDKDAAIGGKVGVMRGSKVVPVEAAANMTAGVLVYSDATGKATPYAAQTYPVRALGVCLADVTAGSGATAQVALF